MTFTCASGLAVNVEAGVPQVTYYSWDPMTGEALAVATDMEYKEVDANTVELSLPEAITEEGMYQLTVPAGYFILDPNGLKVASEGVSEYYNVVDQSPLTITKVTPAEGEVTSLKHIEVVFSHEIGEVYTPVVIVNEVGDTVCTATPSFQDAEGQWYTDYNVMAFVLDKEITEAGTYSLYIPADYIMKVSDGSYFEGAKLVFVIGGTTSIDAVGVDAEVEIYDLTGRRVEKAVKGVYIINGKKVLVK